MSDPESISPYVVIVFSLLLVILRGTTCNKTSHELFLEEFEQADAELMLAVLVSLCDGPAELLSVAPVCLGGSFLSLKCKQCVDWNSNSSSKYVCSSRTHFSRGEI